MERLTVSWNARRHLDAVEHRIAELVRFRDDLAADIADWAREDQTYRSGVR